MVTVLAARWRLGHELYRETGDVDLGITPIVARDHHVVGRLKDLDYTQVAGNRFARGLSDIPVKMKGKEDTPRPEASIDVLVPAYTSRARENVQVGEDLFTTEVPGLQFLVAAGVRLWPRSPLSNVSRPKQPMPASPEYGRLSHMSSGRPDTTIPLRPAVAYGQVRAEEMPE